MRIIDADKAKEEILSWAVDLNNPRFLSKADTLCIIDQQPTVEAEPVVRCKDCRWFVPKHILLDDGTRRAYTEEEKKLPLGVSGDVGINCGSRCLRHLYWEENRIPVWFQENDFCSYGERRG